MMKSVMLLGESWTHRLDPSEHRDAIRYDGDWIRFIREYLRAGFIGDLCCLAAHVNTIEAQKSRSIW